MAQYTEAELKKKRLPELKDLATELELDQTGLSKGGLIEAILHDQRTKEADEVDDELDDEVDDDEVDDDELDDDEVDDTSGVPADMTDEADDEVDDESDEVDDEPAKPAKKTQTVRKEATKKAKQEAGVEGNTLAAKQVATALNTEAKTLRQFFRSDASTVEAVGSGGRYEFAEEDLPQIKAEFEKWKSEHAGRGRAKGDGSNKKDRAAAAAAAAPVVDDIEEIEELDDEELDEVLNADELELDDEEDD